MPKLVICLFVLCGLDNPIAQAQLFGRPRTIGRPLSRSAGPGSLDQEGVGTLTGNERFIRGNRGRAAFVGADLVETQSFVGSQQARTSGTIVSSTAGVEPAPDTSQRINRPLTAARSGQMYLPKIVINTNHISADLKADLNQWVTTRVQLAVNLVSTSGISASVEGRTAILRGVVGSDEERRLVETLVSFEPGISTVRNLLQTPAPDPPEIRPPATPPPVPEPLPPSVPAAD